MSVDSDGLGRSAASGTSWTVAGQLVRTALLFVSTAVLARLLTPGVFGVMAVVTSVVALGELVYQMGLSTAAARQAELSSAQRSNLFWVNTGLGVLLAVACFLLASPASALLSMPSLGPALQAVSVTFVLNGAAAQFRAEVNRRLRFRALAAIDTVPAVFGLLCALAVSAQTRSVWVLVAQYVGVSVLTCALAVWLGRWAVGLPDRHASIREIVRFGTGLFGTQAIAYVTKNIDNLAIAYVLGPGPLGLYSRAYQLLMAPMAQLTAPLTRVYVPVLSRVSSDSERHLRYLTLVGTVPVALLGPIYALAAGAAAPVVDILFGPQWTEAVPVFQVLALGGIFRSFAQLSFWAYLSLDATGAQLRFYLWSQPIVVVAILAGLPWGILGVAVGHSVGYALIWVLGVWRLGAATGLRSAPLLGEGLRALTWLCVPVGGLAFVLSGTLTWSWLALGSSIAAALVWTALIARVTPYGRELADRGRSALATLRRA